MSEGDDASSTGLVFAAVTLVLFEVATLACFVGSCIVICWIHCKMGCVGFLQACNAHQIFMECFHYSLPFNEILSRVNCIDILG